LKTDSTKPPEGQCNNVIATAAAGKYGRTQNAEGAKVADGTPLWTSRNAARRTITRLRFLKQGCRRVEIGGKGVDWVHGNRQESPLSAMLSRTAD